MIPSKAEVKAYYDEQSLRKIKDYVVGNARADAATAALMRWMPAEPARVFEVGCGVGYTSFHIASIFDNCQVTGFDISEKSIEIAQKLFVHPHTEYIQADQLRDINLLGAKPAFDMIFLIDVLEHIPLNERTGLYNFIKENLSPNGRVFLACPTPAFLAWLKVHDPANIQPVDEDITPAVLQLMAEETKTSLVYYEEKNIWRRGDYFHAVLSRGSFTGVPIHKILPNRKSGIIHRIKKKISAGPHSFLQQRKKKEKQEERRLLVKNNLGVSI